METLKINYILYSMIKTGGQIAPLNFATRLAKMGHEVTITTGQKQDWFPLDDVEVRSLSNFQYRKFLLTNDLLVKKFGISKTLSHIRFLRSLGKIMPSSDVNIATFAPTAYLSYWNARNSVPLFHMQHFETLFDSDPGMRRFIRSSYYLPIEKIANSTWLQNRIQELTGEKPRIIKHGIDHKVFYPRETKSKGDHVLDIVALGKGGFKSAKDVVIAFKEANSQLMGIPSMRLHMFGLRPPDGVQFDNNSLFFHQNISDEELAALYSSSDIQITYSTAESFPLPPLEAMACGTAVITTPYGLEDYAIDGHNALFVKPKDIDSLVKAIVKLAKDPELRERLAKSGIETSKQYDFDLITPEFERIIKQSMDSWTTREKKLEEIFSAYQVPI